MTIRKITFILNSALYCDDQKLKTALEICKLVDRLDNMGSVMLDCTKILSSDSTKGEKLASIQSIKNTGSFLKVYVPHAPINWQLLNPVPSLEYLHKRNKSSKKKTINK